MGQRGRGSRALPRILDHSGRKLILHVVLPTLKQSPRRRVRGGSPDDGGGAAAASASSGGGAGRACLPRLRGRGVREQIEQIGMQSHV